MADERVTADQIGWYLIPIYYERLQSEPGSLYRHYGHDSTMERIDGDATRTANTIQDINSLLTTLNFDNVEINTINSLRSMGDGLLILVSGFVRMKDSNVRRMFIQSFFLVKDGRQYYVLSEIFRLLDAAPELPEDNAETEQDLSNPDPETQVSLGSSSQPLQDDANDKDSEVEVQKKTYASITRDGKKPQSEASTSKRQSVVQRLQVPYMPRTNNIVEDYNGQGDQGKQKLVYVGDLPNSITDGRLRELFKQFGTIRPDGIHIKSQPNTGHCYAFVHFQNTASVDAILKGGDRSQLNLDGKTIYIRRRT